MTDNLPPTTPPPKPPPPPPKPIYNKHSGDLLDQPVELDVIVGDGKYRVFQKNGRLTAFRYGETWRDCCGDGLIYTLASTVETLREENKDLTEKLDALLNHCKLEGGECSVCAEIICPHEDPMHFHHDGCPSCIAGGD